MPHKFELFHLSLLQRDQHDMFPDYGQGLTREAWLRKAFGESFPFLHYGSEFHYVPYLEDGADPDADPVIVGRVGRHVIRDENRPPSEGLEEFQYETWIAAALVLDPAHGDDGQKLALQIVPEVGKPISLVKAIVSALNEEHPHGPYAIQAGHIVDDQSFWNFLEENRGGITSLVFEFNVPNMWGSEDEWSEDMRNFRDEEHARKVKLAVHNQDGINPETDRMKSVAKYAMRGDGSSIRARAKGSKSYNSVNEIKRTMLDEIEETGIALVKRARALAERILGRE